MTHRKTLLHLARQLSGGIEAGEYRRLPVSSIRNLRSIALQLEQLAALICIDHEPEPVKRSWWRIW